MNTENKKATIIGGGPAGLAAGVYSVRAGVKTAIIEKLFAGGSMLLTEKIDNYPGFPEGVSGYELAEKMKSQYLRFGGEIIQGDVDEVFFEGVRKRIRMKDGREEEADALIIASGSSRKKLGIEGEDEYTGKGVSFCAVCDGAFFKGKKIAVIGGGDSALEEAVYLTRFAEKCYLIHRRDEFRASAYLQNELKKHSVQTVLSAVPERIEGDGKTVKRVILRRNKTDEMLSFEADGVFISIGQKPNVEFINGKVEQNPAGYIVTNYKMETSEKGVFACGDVIKKTLYQVVTACGEGATAAASAEKYLSAM
ncbi:MAG: thioredoxin-disulfide reductase [Candidatus Omnitrophica bacterium]|nr:thioredoxin-disulfide reductase [Candidatus Omnitrophota bacterium]